MNDNLALLWLNIDNFNYKDRNKLAIHKNDVESLRVARRNFLLKPGMCLIFTMIFGKYRNRIWSSTKRYFIGERRKDNIYKQVNTAEHAKESVVIEYRKNENNFDFDESNKIALNNSRSLRSSRKKNENAENTTNINLTRTEPTFNEEYLGFMNKYRSNIHKLGMFKKYSSKLTGKETILNNGENFLLKTKLIYIPFIVFLLLSLYDLTYTYIGCYFKYQPLVDEYYDYKMKKINNKNI